MSSGKISVCRDTQHGSERPGLAVGYQGGLAVTGADGSDGVGHVDDERRSSHRGAVGEHRLDAEVLGGGQRGEPCGQDPVDIAHLEAGIFQSVVRRLGVVLQRRLAGHVAHNVGLGNSHNGDVPRSRRSHNRSPNCK